MRANRRRSLPNDRARSILARERMGCTMVMRIRGRTARRVRCLAAQWRMTPEEVIEVVVSRYAAQLGIDLSSTDEAPAQQPSHTGVAPG